MSWDGWGGWGGWGGWDDNVPWTCTHTCLRISGMGGVGGMITCLGLAHILASGSAGMGMGGIGGMGGMVGWVG